MWRLGFFFHEMAFGLLSIFLPLYVIAIGGSLVDLGIMSASALFLVIPSSYFWGYVCDRTRRYKRYILLSFLALTLILYFFTFTTNVGLLIILYALLSVFHVANEPPKNVLIAELYSREEWEKTFAFYEGFTEIGLLIGLLLGFLMSTYGFGAASTLLLCSILNLVAFFISLILVTDPLLVFERRLVSIEKTIDFAYRGVTLLAKIWDGVSVNERLRKENVRAFCSGLVLFSLASSILFTPLPIFISNTVKASALPASVVFVIYLLNSSGGVVGYFLAGNRSRGLAEKAHVGKIAIFRSVLAFLLIAVVQMPAYNLLLVTTILVLMGFVYALFLVYTLSLSMELIPAGKAGLFNVLVGIGGACGSFAGPFLAQALGFTYVFLTASIIFFSAYIAFRIFT